MSGVIDEIERLGAAVERGELDPAEAAYRVAQCSDGGLDLDTADDFVRHWRTANARQQTLVADTANALLAVALDLNLPRGAR